MVVIAFQLSQPTCDSVASVLAIKAFLQALLDDTELCTLWSRYLWLSCWFSCLLSVIITCLVFSFLLSHNSES